MCSQVSSGDADRKFGLDSFRKNWFSEQGTLADDHSLSIEVKSVVHREESEYQDILVFDSKKFGRCLALGNVLQYAKENGFAYHEMITFLPMNSHPNPKKVLIIGDGSGGILGEVTKFSSVDTIVMCEMDSVAIDVSKKYFPLLAKGFQSSKLTIRTEDGMEYLKTTREEFDVIIADTRNPLGSVARVCKNSNLDLLKSALKPGGIIAFQAKCYWFDTPKVKEVIETCRSLFSKVDYASVLVPSFPGGQVGIVLCGISAVTNFREPIHKLTSQTLKALKLRYYTPDVHRASFAHPLWMSKELGLKNEVFLF